MMTPALAVTDLSKRYGDLIAVDHIDLTVAQGEVFGLLGPNGAGKTTAIAMLTGVITPDSGTITIEGHDLRAEPEAAKRLIGLVPQDLALYPTLTARDNLDFFGRLYGLHGPELKARIAEMLELVGLQDRADEPIERFSGGMKRRANIAAGLLHYPRLLFLDEPTVGVDPQSRNHIFESVQRLSRERGMTILYTSHYMEEVELLCDRVAIMDRGRIIAQDTVPNLVSVLAGSIRLGLARVDYALLAGLQAIPGVTAVSLVEDATAPAEPEAMPAAEPGYRLLLIETSHVQQALPEALALLNHSDTDIVSLQVLEPNLENVFLHLTGKSLRE